MLKKVKQKKHKEIIHSDEKKLVGFRQFLKKIQQKTKIRLTKFKAYFRKRESVLYFDEYSNEQLGTKNVIVSFLLSIWTPFFSKVKNTIYTLLNDVLLFRWIFRKKKKALVLNRLEKNKTILYNFDRCIFLNEVNKSTPHKRFIQLCKKYVTNTLYQIYNIEIEKEQLTLNENKDMEQWKQNFNHRINNLHEFDSDDMSYMSDDKLIKQLMNTDKNEHNCFNNEKKLKRKKQKDKLDWFDKHLVKTYLIRNSLSLKGKVNKCYPHYKNVIQSVIALIGNRMKSSIFYILLLISGLQYSESLETKSQIYIFSVICIYCVLSILKDLQEFTRDSILASHIHKRTFKKLTPIGLVNVKYYNIKIGDVLLLHKNEEVPSDVVLIKTFGKTKNVVISSSTFDGNTILQRKECLKITEMLPNIYDLFRLKIKISLGKPNEDPNVINGSLTLLNYREFAKSLHEDLIVLKKKFYENLNDETSYTSKEIFNFMVKDTYIDKCFNCFTFLVEKSKEYFIESEFPSNESGVFGATTAVSTYYMNKEMNGTICVTGIESSNFCERSGSKISRRSVHSLGKSNLTYENSTFKCNQKMEEETDLSSKGKSGLTKTREFQLKKYMHVHCEESDSENEYTSELDSEENEHEQIHTKHKPAFCINVRGMYNQDETKQSITDKEEKNEHTNLDYYHLSEKINLSSLKKYSETITTNQVVWSKNKIVHGDVYAMVLYIGSDTKANISIKEQKRISQIEKEVSMSIQNFFPIIIILGLLVSMKEALLSHSWFLLPFLRHVLLISAFVPFFSSFYIYTFNKYCHKNLMKKRTNIAPFTIRNYYIANEFTNTSFLICDKTGTLTKRKDIQFFSFSFYFDEFIIQKSYFFIHLFLRVVDLSLLGNKSDEYRKNHIIRNIEKYDAGTNLEIHKQVFKRILSYSNEEIDTFFFTFLCILLCNSVVVAVEESSETEEPNKQSLILSNSNEWINNKKKKKKKEQKTEINFLEVEPFSVCPEENAMVHFLENCGMHLIRKDTEKVVLGIGMLPHKKITEKKDLIKKEKRVKKKERRNPWNYLKNVYRNSKRKIESINYRRGRLPMIYSQAESYRPNYVQRNQWTEPMNPIRSTKQGDNLNNPQPSLTLYTFKILEMQPFHSKNQMMSILVSFEGRIFNFVKGSDDRLIPLLHPSENKEMIRKTCEEFGKKALRVFLFAYREVTQTDFETYYNSREQHMTTNQEHLQNNIVKEHRKYDPNYFHTNLHFLSIGTFKEPLQDNAKACLEKFSEANIKTWILSGDQKENVLSVSKALHLIDKHNYFCHLNLGVFTKWCKKNQLETYQSRKSSNLSLSLTDECKSKENIHLQNESSNAFNTHSIHSVKEWNNPGRPISMHSEFHRYLPENNYEEEENLIKMEWDDITLNETEQEAYKQTLCNMLYNHTSCEDTTNKEMYEKSNEQIQNEKNTMGEWHFENIVYLIHGDILDTYFKFCEQELIKVLKMAKCVIIYRCNSINKGLVVHSLKKNMQCTVCSVGDDANDINMFNSSDIAISINNYSTNISTFYADLEMPQFDEIFTLFFIYGGKICINLNTMIQGIFLRGLLFLFLQSYCSYFMIPVSYLSNWYILWCDMIFTLLTYIPYFLFDREEKPREPFENIHKHKLSTSDIFSLIDLYKLSTKALLQASIIFFLSYKYYITNPFQFEIIILSATYISSSLNCLIISTEINLIIHLTLMFTFMLYVLILCILYNLKHISFYTIVILYFNVLLVSLLANIPISIIFFIISWRKKKASVITIKSYDSFSSSTHEVFQIDSFSM